MRTFPLCILQQTEKTIYIMNSIFFFLLSFMLHCKLKANMQSIFQLQFIRTVVHIKSVISFIKVLFLMSNKLVYKICIQI